MTRFLIFTLVVFAMAIWLLISGFLPLAVTSLIAFTAATWLFIRQRLPLGLALLAVFITPAAHAAGIDTIANPVIDQVQGEVVTWLITGVVSAFFGLASWFGGAIGIRVVERLNRATIQEAAERYANGLIDLAQARYLDANPSAVTDLVASGIDYIKGGNAGTVKQSKIKDDRLGAYVVEAIQKVKADRLSAALDRALSSKNATGPAA